MRPGGRCRRGPAASGWRPDDIFVLSADPDSFDSRYMGPIDRAHVVGFALPVWVRQAAPISAPAAS